MEQKREKIYEVCVFIGILIVFSVILYSINNYFGIKKEKMIEENLIEEFLEQNEETINENNDTFVDIGKEKVEYVYVLEIPKIGLKKGIYDINYKYNYVSYNIQILKESDNPNINNGNFMLASHNGTSSVSYFKNLSNLNIGDNIYVYFNGIKYNYILDSYYEVIKDGTAEIYRDNSRTTITLITCKKNSKDKQIVYIGYLADKSEY